jgi:hypothetical protein
LFFKNLQVTQPPRQCTRLPLLALARPMHREAYNTISSHLSCLRIRLLLPNELTRVIPLQALRYWPLRTR